MRLSSFLFGLFAISLTGAAGCGLDVTTVDPSELPTFMQAEDKAFDIKAWKQSDSTSWLTYKVQAAYSPEGIISSLSERLRSSGFLELPFHWSEPDTPSSRIRGWSTWNHELGGSTIGVHDWQVSWIHPDGDMVLYELQYRGEPHGDIAFQPSDSDVLEVTVTHFPAAVTATRSPHSLEWLGNHDNT
jgi:hypothetical protein